MKGEEKLRVTFYLTKSSFEKLNKMCANNLLNGKNMARSATICEAIDFLYKANKK